MPMIVLLLPTGIMPLRAIVAVTTTTAAFVPATALVKAESELTIVRVAFPPPVVPCPRLLSHRLHRPRSPRRRHRRTRQHESP